MNELIQIFKLIMAISANNSFDELTLYYNDKIFNKFENNYYLYKY